MSGKFAIEIVGSSDFFFGVFAIARIRFAIRTYELLLEHSQLGTSMFSISLNVASQERVQELLLL